MSDHAIHPFLLIFVATAFACAFFVDGDSLSLQSAQPVAPWTMTESSNPTAAYRFTNNGWEDSTSWRINGEEAKAKFIDQIHPLVWSVLIILVVYALAILVSDEEQLRRLWPHNEG